MKTIWTEQLKHVSCIKNPPGVELYTITGHLRKGGVMLAVYRYACSSSSLESFHLHLTSFVPGSSAGAVNFQAYILDGINRWNTAHSEAAIPSPLTSETQRIFKPDFKARYRQDKLHCIGTPRTDTLLSVSMLSYYNCTTRIIVYFV